MANQLRPPDLVISMYPDPRAPRAARYCVGKIERPSPELRDSLVLLTSELVSRAVRLHEGSSPELVELRVWTRSEVARVELRGARALVCQSSDSDEPQDALVLVDQLADRWSIDADERRACIWFEIDRHQKTSSELARARLFGLRDQADGITNGAGLRRGACRAGALAGGRCTGHRAAARSHGWARSHR
jgi:hypothetical protein